PGADLADHGLTRSSGSSFSDNTEAGMNTCEKQNAIDRELEGLSTFHGAVLWGAEAALNARLEGKRVAIIGDGAIEVKVLPQQTGRVEKVNVFQRNAGWILPDLDYIRSVLPAPGLERIARTHLERQVRDPWIRRQLTPDFPLDRPHVAVSSDY